MGATRAFLTNEQRLALREHWTAQPQLTRFEIADWVRAQFQIDISRSALYRISQAADDAFAGNLRTKKNRRVKFPAFEKDLLAYYHACRRSDSKASPGARPPLTGDSLARKAAELRDKHGIAHDKLKLSNGWLHSFKERHGLRRIPTAAGLLRAEERGESRSSSGDDDGEVEKGSNEAEESAAASAQTTSASATAVVGTPASSPAATPRRTASAAKRDDTTPAQPASNSSVAARGDSMPEKAPTRDPAAIPVSVPVIGVRDPVASPSASTRQAPTTPVAAPSTPIQTPTPPSVAAPLPTPSPVQRVQPLVRITAKALSAVRSPGTLNWELVTQQPPAAESHFEIVNDGIQILQEGVYQINVDLQHTTKSDASFAQVFSVWNGTTRLDQCTSILCCDASGSALSVSESQCFLAASACIRVDFKAPGHALPSSRIVIRLVST